MSASSPPSSDSPLDSSTLLTSVVKLFTISAPPNFSMPWQIKKQKSSTASGFVVDLALGTGQGQPPSGEFVKAGTPSLRILTNAHAVSYATSILVRKHGVAKKFPARVVAVAHSADLALLDVIDAADFWEGLPALTFGPVPELHEQITVVGYPTGGDNISVTSGVVSRVDLTDYSHGGNKLLTVQIDAAINGGNSGGPAFAGAFVAGVAFETLNDSENIGYIIPETVVRHFLNAVVRTNCDVSASAIRSSTNSPLVYTPSNPALPPAKQPLMLDPFCDLGLKCQTMENVQSKESFGLAKRYIESGSGVLVIRVWPVGRGHGYIVPGDILLAINGVEIADDGTIPFRKSERISFAHLLHDKFAGDEVAVKVWRSCAEVDIKVPVGGSTPPLVKVTLYDERPSFFVHAGLVFVPLSQPFLRNTWGSSWDSKAPIRLCEQTFYGTKQTEDQESVVLAHVLAADVNIGYRGVFNRVVLRVNGVSIKNLAHLVEIVEATELGSETDKKFLRIDLDLERSIILRADIAEQSNAEIFSQHNITDRCSVDLTPKLRARPT